MSILDILLFILGIGGLGCLAINFFKISREDWTKEFYKTKENEIKELEKKEPKEIIDKLENKSKIEKIKSESDKLYDDLVR